MSNSAAHEMSLVHDRAVNPDVWKTAQEVFEDKETRTVDLAIPKRRTGHRVTQFKAVIKPLTLNDGRFVIIYGTDESENVRMESARRDFVANVSHELKTPSAALPCWPRLCYKTPVTRKPWSTLAIRFTRKPTAWPIWSASLFPCPSCKAPRRCQKWNHWPSMTSSRKRSRNQLAAEARSIELNRGASVGVQVKGDRSLLVTALSNLVSNAINYSPEKMPVSVSQKVVDGGVVLIRVTDRGIGIAPDDQKRVFERFFRVDQARSRQTGGTGLGLAIVKHVVANHGGNIKLWSRPGTGSTFTIELPIYREEKPAQDAGMKDNEKRDAVDAAAFAPRAVARVAARRKDKAQ